MILKGFITLYIRILIQDGALSPPVCFPSCSLHFPFIPLFFSGMSVPVISLYFIASVLRCNPVSLILYVANSVSGPPSFAAVNIMFSMSFGRTDLRLSPSREKYAEESDFDVRLAVAPPKPCQISEKTNF